MSLKAEGAVIGTYEATALQASGKYSDQLNNSSSGQVPGADPSNNVDMM